MSCPRCGTRSRGGNFCDDCGWELGKTCSFCSAPNRSGARFCVGCGKAFDETLINPPTTTGPNISAPQQKFVTIVFADICGSTKTISSLDPEDSADVLGQVLRVVATSVR